MEEICLQYIPKKFMAKIIYCENCIDDFFNGIEKSGCIIINGRL